MRNLWGFCNLITNRSSNYISIQYNFKKQILKKNENIVNFLLNGWD